MEMRKAPTINYLKTMKEDFEANLSQEQKEEMMNAVVDTDVTLQVPVKVLAGRFEGVMETPNVTERVSTVGRPSSFDKLAPPHFGLAHEPTVPPTTSRPTASST